MDKHFKTLCLAAICLLFCALSQTQAAPTPLSDKTTISLLTCEQGEELYSIFGHSAIRVNDPVNKVDKVYNYGTFNFDTPNFYPKFIRGQLEYTLGVNTYERFMRAYRYDQRSVSEQVFIMDSSQMNKIYSLLEENYLPENRNYRYDFFYDNCATRIRDIIENSFKGDFKFVIPEDEPEMTYRQRLDYFLKDAPWADFGIDLILGYPSDKQAGFYGKMFLPDYLKEGLLQGEISSVPLISTDRSVFKAAPASPKKSLWTPSVVFWIICLIYAIISMLNWAHPITRVLDFILFGLAGIAGIQFLFMWFGTNHIATHQNLNMLWAFPLHIILAIQFFRKELTGFWWYYLWAVIIMNIVILIGWYWWPQQYHVAIIPILIAMIIRAFEHVWEW